MSRLNRVFTVLTLTLVVSAPAFAASYVVPPDRILAEKSHAILVGHVTGSHVEKTAKQGIETVYDVAVDDVIKGAPGFSVKVREMGGQLGDEARIIFGAPHFERGERVLLFLRSIDDGQYTTTDLALGAFRFARDTAGQDLVVRDEAEIFGWDLDGSSHKEIRRSAARFLTYLREISNAVPAPAAQDYAVPAHPLREAEPRLQQDATSPRLQPNVVFTATSYTISFDASETGMGFRWRTFPAAVNWNQGNTEPGAPGNGTTAINAAFAAWNNDGCSNVNYVLTSSNANTVGIEGPPDGVNNVVFEHDFGSPFVCGNGGVLGVGGISRGWSGTCSMGQDPNTCQHMFNGETFATTVEGDVSMNKGIANCTSLFTSGDFNSAVTHEVGHTLGFRHANRNRITGSFPGEAACSTDASLECATSAIMTSVVTGGINGALQAWDQHAVQKVYASTCAGTSVKGDFTGDGKPDIVWRNNSNGANAVWEMNGTVATGVIINLDALPNTQYQIAGTADFNGDGKQDILWRNSTTGANALWLMNGATVTSIVNLPGLPGSNFSFEGVADFDGNGTPDIIIRNYANGNNALWLMNGTNYMGTVNLPALPNTNYHIESAADFDGNGTPDIVWRNYDPAGIGAVALWTMTGTTQTGIVNLPALPNVDYKLSGVGDFNGDGKPDIVWRNPVTGANAIWLMNGTAYSSTVNLPGLANSSYEIRGPR